MAGEKTDGEAVGVARGTESPITVEITPRLIGLSMGAGLVGMVVMAPLLVGVPLALGIFRAEPLVEFANIGSFFGLSPSVVGPVFGYDPSLVVGALIFALGGILFLPVQFLVVASYLPPESPRFARGGTLALLWWGGFLFAFWPGGSLTTGVFFVLFSGTAHLLYGLTLGYLVDHFAEIPQHEV